jgi:hypothetical protein
VATAVAVDARTHHVKGWGVGRDLLEAADRMLVAD